MSNPKFVEKICTAALEKFKANAPPDHDGHITVDDLYKLLDTNAQKKLRKHTIHMYLQKKGLILEGDSMEEDQAPISSQSSSASDDLPKDGDDADDDFVKYLKKDVRNRPPTPGPFKQLKNNSDVRERSARTIKRKQVFDPSDFSKPSRVKKSDKAEKTDSEEKLEETGTICKVCNEDLSILPPDTKPMEPHTCDGCGKWRVHGACVAWERQPWRCEDCRQCSLCQGKRSPRGEPMVTCRICQEPFHQRCASGPKSKAPDGWFCSSCMAAFREESQQKVDSEYFDTPSKSASPPESLTKPKTRGRKPSNAKKDAQVPVMDMEEETLDEIPDCSNWTPQQVHSYFQMFVPSQDAQTFLDQEIDGRSLQLLQRGDVITKFSLKLGPALKVYAQVKRLQERSSNIQLCWP